MTDHPLTVEMIEQIAQFEPDLTDQLRLNRTNDMRVAADWQLEADAHWWKIILKEANFLPPDALDDVIEKFKQAMRTQLEKNND